MSVVVITLMFPQKSWAQELKKKYSRTILAQMASSQAAFVAEYKELRAKKILPDPSKATSRGWGKQDERHEAWNR